MNNFFQFSDKKVTCLTRAEITVSRIPRNRELNWIFLSISSVFYTLSQQSFYFISFCSFEGVQYFLVELFIYFSKLPSASNQ